MFEKYNRQVRTNAATHPVRFTIVVGLWFALVCGLAFRNVFAGLVGGALTTLFSWYWWRPDGPGRRRGW